MAASDVVRMARPNWPDASEPQDRRPMPAELQPGLGHRLHAVGRAMRRRFERSVRQAGLPITRLQAALLIRIARNPGLSQTAVAADSISSRSRWCACSTGCTRRGWSSAAPIRPTGGCARCG